MLQRATRFLGLGRYFWDAIREVNPNEIRTELERPITVGFFGRPGSGRRTLARALLAQDQAEVGGRGISINETDTAAVASAGLLDVAFVVLDATEPDWSAERRIAGQLGARGIPFFVAVTHADDLPTPQQAATAVRNQFPNHPPELTAVVDPRDADATRARLGPAIVKSVPQIRLALAHQFPTLRRAVAEELIRDASWVNAQFALMASLPALIPVLGFFVGGMADILVLTKNQAMLVFRLAAIYGRNMDHRMAILKEIMPVIGGAFVWRTAARTAVGLAPAPISALPRAAIAYVGTYLVGQAARYYYEQGDKPPPEVLRAFQADARRRYQQVNEILKEQFAGGREALLAAPASEAAGGPPSDASRDAAD
jgi:uncharacterized protein (DUF697 family)